MRENERAFLSRLRKPQDGLFMGTVDGYDTSNNTYRITFDRSGLGTNSVPDYEVLCSTEMESLPLSSFTQKAKPRPLPQPVATTPSALTPMKLSSIYSPQLVSDPLLSGSTPKGKVRPKSRPITVSRFDIVYFSLKVS